MFQEISIRHKLYAGAVILLLLFGYSLFYLTQSYSLYQRHKTLEASTSSIHRASQIISEQRSTLQKLDKEVQMLNSGNVEIRNHNHFIQYAEGVCNKYNVKLVSLPVEKVMQMGDYQIAEISLSFEGSYADILQALFQLEYTDKVANVKKMKMETQTVRKDSGKKTYLVASIVLNRLLSAK